MPVSTSGWYSSALRHAPQPVHFGQQVRQRAASAQRIKHARGLALHQAARQFLPDALGHQPIDFAVCHHLAHHGQGFGRDGKVGKARRKARQPQDAHRVFAEGVGDVAQHLGL